VYVSLVVDCVSQQNHTTKNESWHYLPSLVFYGVSATAPF
jgi:hypothetical protein